MQRLLILVLCATLTALSGCSDNSTGSNPDPDDDTEMDDPPDEEEEGPEVGYVDDYRQWSEFSDRDRWGPYNLHDPSCIDDGDWYYCYSTDVMYGMELQRVGVQVRRTQDLVNWEFVGWAFDGIPEAANQYVTQANGGASPENIWAPYIMKSGDTYRLYYSVSVFGSDASYIGLATSSSPEGPWEQQGAVVTTTDSDPMNAIDPTVVVNPDNGEHWMAYGSHFAGLYILQLDPGTGKPLNPDDKGTLIARNESTRIEAPELMYHEELDTYYLFVSYGDLGNNYNVRVGQSDNPQGPYLDYFGNDMSNDADNFPILTSSYRFDGHSGWQGVGHCGIFSDGTDYYMINQGRLGLDPALMVLHLRKLHWSEDGWPLTPPERFAHIPQEDITIDTVSGSWEHIELHPLPEGDTKNNSDNITFNSDGTVTGDFEANWSISNKVISMELQDETIDLVARHGWDWENNRQTIIYTGINSDGLTVWGKKVE